MGVRAGRGNHGASSSTAHVLASFDFRRFLSAFHVRLRAHAHRGPTVTYRQAPALETNPPPQMNSRSQAGKRPSGSALLTAWPRSGARVEVGEEGIQFVRAKEGVPAEFPFQGGSCL